MSAATATPAQTGAPFPAPSDGEDDGEVEEGEMTSESKARLAEIKKAVESGTYATKNHPPTRGKRSTLWDVMAL